MRRGSFQEGTVDYAAVGATQANDLMGYPPEKSRPAEQSWRIGSGEERFAGAADALLSVTEGVVWGWRVAPEYDDDAIATLREQQAI